MANSTTTAGKEYSAREFMELLQNDDPWPKPTTSDTPKELTEEQLKILNELPETPGFYWVENIQTQERNIAKIDKSSTDNTVDHWGHKMQATPGGITVIQRWLVNWIILDEIAEPKEGAEYENNEKYGMF